MYTKNNVYVLFFFNLFITSAIFKDDMSASGTIDLARMAKPWKRGPRLVLNYDHISMNKWFIINRLCFVSDCTEHSKVRMPLTKDSVQSLSSSSLDYSGWVKASACCKGVATRCDSLVRSLPIARIRVNRKVWRVARMSRIRETRVKRNYSSFYFRAESAARAVRLANQSAADI